MTRSNHSARPLMISQKMADFWMESSNTFEDAGRARSQAVAVSSSSGKKPGSNVPPKSGTESMSQTPTEQHRTVRFADEIPAKPPLARCDRPCPLFHEQFDWKSCD